MTDDTQTLFRRRLPDGQNLQWWNEDSMKGPGAKQCFFSNLVAATFGNLRDQVPRYRKIALQKYMS